MEAKFIGIVHFRTINCGSLYIHNTINEVHDLLMEYIILIHKDFEKICSKYKRAGKQPRLALLYDIDVYIQ